MKNFWMAVFLSAWGGVAVHAEHFVGTGVDSPSEDSQSAWFHKGRNVHYCLERSTKFLFSMEVVARELERAFERWAQYGAQKHVSWVKQILLKRDANCSRETDLKIYLGTSSDQVTTAQKRYLNPVAFVEKTEVSSDHTWSRGFMWLSASYQNLPWTLNRLRGILLHEVGHIFGCRHVEGTIMSEDVDHYLSLDKETVTDLMARSIDWDRELVHCKGCSQHWEIHNATHTLRYADAFESLLSYVPQNARVKMALEQGDPLVDAQAFRSMLLTIEWPGTRHVFPIRFDYLWVGDPAIGVPEFVHFLAPSSKRILRNFYSDNFYGTLQLPNGETELVVLDYNRARGIYSDESIGGFYSSHGPIELYLLRSKMPKPEDGIRRVPLFIAPAFHPISMKKM